MKKIVSLIVTIVLCLGVCCMLSSCGKPKVYKVGLCQYGYSEQLDAATKAFVKGLNETVGKSGISIMYDDQIASSPEHCDAIMADFIANGVNLIFANGAPCVVSAAKNTTEIPVVATSVVDYSVLFPNGIPANVCGIFNGGDYVVQAQAIVDSMKLASQDAVGILYSTLDTYSSIHYEGMKRQLEEKGMTVKGYCVTEVSGLEELILEASKACKVLYVCSDDKLMEQDSLIGATCFQGRLPMFTGYPSSVSYADYAVYDLEQMTGEMAAQILMGKKAPSDYAIQTIPGEVKYDFANCAEYEIVIPQ